MAGRSSRHIEPLLSVTLPKLETLTENFSAGTVDLAKWAPYGTTSTTRGQLNCSSPAASATYSGVDSVGRFDLTNSYVHVQATLGVTSGAHEYTFDVNRAGDLTNKLTYYNSGGAFAARVKTNNTNSDTAIT